MGELRRDISKISRGYTIYTVLISDGRKNTAARAMNDEFPRFAYRIGGGNVIVQLLGNEAMEQAATKFKLKWNDKYPLLLIMDKHPDDVNLDNGDKVIKIHLGDYDSEDEIMNFLSSLENLIASNDFGRLVWERRKERIIEVAQKIPYIEIVSTALNRI